MSEEKSKAKVFAVVTDEFVRAVKWAAKLTAQGKDNSLIAVKIENGTMIMSSYNGINSSKSKSDVTQKFDGELEFSVNGNLLSNAIKSIKDSELTMSVDGRTLAIKSAKARFSLPITMPRNKLVLPPLPPAIGKVDAKEFKTLLNHAISMTSDDVSTPALMTVHVEFNMQNSEIQLMATDRYKLVVRKMKYTPSNDSEEANTFGVDVEARSFKTLLADLNDEDELTLYASSGNDNRQLGIATTTQIGMVSLKDVKPLNFAQFLTMSHSNHVVIKRSDLTQAISLTKPLIEGTLKGADLVIGSDSMTLVSPMTDIDIDVVSSDFEEDMEVHMNLDFLTPLLSAGKSEFVGFNIENAGKAIIVQEMTDKDTVNRNYFSLVMPVRKGS
jgi:DNA polymerase-3 subunit beta